MTLADDAYAMIRHHGESVVYKPSGGSNRTIYASVNRQIPTNPGVPGASGPRITIAVTTSVTLGILPSELNLGKDLISVALRYGGTAEDRRIVSIISQDEGCMMLEVG